MSRWLQTTLVNWCNGRGSFCFNHFVHEIQEQINLINRDNWESPFSYLSENLINTNLHNNSHLANTQFHYLTWAKTDDNAQNHCLVNTCEIWLWDFKTQQFHLVSFNIKFCFVTPTQFPGVDFSYLYPDDFFDQFNRLLDRNLFYFPCCLTWPSVYSIHTKDIYIENWDCDWAYWKRNL
jgi:hypothetical protein